MVHNTALPAYDYLKQKEQMDDQQQVPAADDGLDTRPSTIDRVRRSINRASDRGHTDLIDSHADPADG
jgi:hypothetical protein